MLCEVASALSGADAADPVVDVDVPAMPDVRPRQCCDDDIHVTGTKSAIGVGGRQCDARQDRKYGSATRVCPEAELRTKLDVPEARGAQVASFVRQQPVGAHARLQPIREADTEREG